MTGPGTAQPLVELPGKALVRANVCGGVLGAAAGFVGGLIFGQGPAFAGWVAVGAALTAVVAVLGTMLLRPHRKRPILTWASLLIVVATGRLIASGGLCLLLYFAAQLPVAPLLIGMLLTLAIVLFSETRIAARRFSQAAPAAATRDLATRDPEA